MLISVSRYPIVLSLFLVVYGWARHDSVVAFLLFQLPVGSHFHFITMLRSILFLCVDPLLIS